MIAFLILLIPAALLMYWIWTKEKKDIIAIFCGLISATVFTALKVFFTFSHRLVPYSFSENFGYYLAKYSCLPVLVVFIVFSLVAKDTIEYKVKSFFPLVSSFYMVYLPYSIMSFSSSIYSGYEIFLKPLVYLAMLVQCGLSINSIYRSVISKKILFVIVNILLFIFYLIFPAISDALYAINYKFALIVVFDILFMIVPFGLCIFYLIKAIFSK